MSKFKGKPRGKSTGQAKGYRKTKLRSKGTEQKNSLTLKETEWAEDCVIKGLQKKAFAGEIISFGNSVPMTTFH